MPQKEESQRDTAEVLEDLFGDIGESRRNLAEEEVEAYQANLVNALFTTRTVKNEGDKAAVILESEDGPEFFVTPTDFNSYSEVEQAKDEFRQVVAQERTSPLFDDLDSAMAVFEELSKNEQETLLAGTWGRYQEIDRQVRRWLEQNYEERLDSLELAFQVGRFGEEYPEDKAVDDIVSQHIDTIAEAQGLDIPAFTLSKGGFLQVLDQFQDEVEVLLDHYAPVQISVETGMPASITKGTETRGFSYLRRRQDDVEEDLESMRREVIQYINEQEWQDEIKPQSRDFNSVGDLLQRLRTDLEETSKLDIYRGRFPERQQEAAFEIERLEELHRLDTFTPLAKNLEAETVGEDDEYTLFDLTTADFSTPKDDSLLFYRITGLQDNDTSWYSIGSKLPVRDTDDGYKISRELNAKINDLYDLAAEQVLESLNSLGDDDDISYGENLQVASVESIRVGPFYFQGMETPPVTTEEAVEQLGLEDEEELAEEEPELYIGAGIRDFLDDNPEGYVLTVEKRKATSTPDPDGNVRIDREFTFAVPDGLSFEDYVPETVYGDRENIYTETVRVPDLEPFEYGEEIPFEYMDAKRGEVQSGVEA